MERNPPPTSERLTYERAPAVMGAFASSASSAKVGWRRGRRLNDEALQREVAIADEKVRERSTSGQPARPDVSRNCSSRFCPADCVITATACAAFVMIAVTAWGCDT